jgi:hypothetical protein
VEIMINAMYDYNIVAANNTVTATARANLDDDGTVDEWRIDQTGVLTCVTNDVTT